MSGIYIPMEMPKSGHTVTLTITGGGEAVVQYYDCKPQLTVPIVYKAVPVPPHGDLIDRDALIAKLESYGYQGGCIGFVEDAPAIIPSD